MTSSVARFPRLREYFTRHDTTLADIREAVRQKIISAVKEATAIDGRHGADAVTTEAGCLCASLAAQNGGADSLKTHLENVERDGRAHLPDYRLWAKPNLP